MITRSDGVKSIIQILHVPPELIISSCVGCILSGNLIYSFFINIVPQQHTTHTTTNINGLTHMTIIINIHFQFITNQYPIILINNTFYFIFVMSLNNVIIR